MSTFFYDWDILIYVDPNENLFNFISFRKIRSNKNILHFNNKNENPAF